MVGEGLQMVRESDLDEFGELVHSRGLLLLIMTIGSVIVEMGIMGERGGMKREMGK